MNQLKIVMMKTSELIPYENNPRINDNAVDAVAKSILEFGFKNPIIIDKDNVIVCGHTRLRSAIKLGLQEVPCIIAEDLTDDQIKAYRLADNKTAELADWDFSKLEEELKLIDLDMSPFGFEQILDSIQELPEDDEFDADTELDKEAFVKKGDIWQLGRHKLMCGDSTTKDVETLMEGNQADLVITDSPYNVDYEGGNGDKIQNDHMGSEEFYTFLNKVFNNMATILKPGAAYYEFFATREHVNFENALKANGLTPRQELIWSKNGMFTLGRQDYQWDFEPCQPAGTMVRTSNGDVPIEELKDGDTVLSFDTYSGQVKGYKNGLPIKTAKRMYKGDLYFVEVDGKVTKATDNHKFSVRFRDDAKTKYCTYLMRRGNWWRVGITETYNARGFGVKQRMRQEKADEAWILGLYDDKNKAQIAEQTITCKYGIPYTHWETERFEFQKEKVHVRTTEDIKMIYANLDLNQLNASASKCLLDFGRRIQYPLITLENRIDAMSCRVTTKVQACNLVPGLMEVPIPYDKYDGCETFKWMPIESIKKEYFEGLVYSLEVERYEHYIADGIIVHNCLYGWKDGAAHNWYSDRKQKCVVCFDKPTKNEYHPTQKPVPLIAYLMKNSSRPNDLVIDLFGGSGTTLIAAEEANRKCFLMEIDEKYASAIVRRYAKLKGGMNDIYCIRDGVMVKGEEIYKPETESLLA